MFIKNLSKILILLYSTRTKLTGVLIQFFSYKKKTVKSRKDKQHDLT